MPDCSSRAAEARALAPEEQAVEMVCAGPRMPRCCARNAATLPISCTGYSKPGGKCPSRARWHAAASPSSMPPVLVPTTRATRVGPKRSMACCTAPCKACAAPQASALLRERWCGGAKSSAGSTLPSGRQPSGRVRPGE